MIQNDKDDYLNILVNQHFLTKPSCPEKGGLNVTVDIYIDTYW